LDHRIILGHGDFRLFALTANQNRDQRRRLRHLHDRRAFGHGDMRTGLNDRNAGGLFCGGLLSNVVTGLIGSSFVSGTVSISLYSVVGLFCIRVLIGGIVRCALVSVVCCVRGGISLIGIFRVRHLISIIIFRVISGLCCIGVGACIFR